MFKIKSDNLKKVVSEICSAFKHSKVEGAAIKLATNSETGLLTISASGENISFEKYVKVTVEKASMFYTTPYELQLKVSTLPEEVYVNVTENDKGHYYLSWGRGNGILLLTCSEETITNLDKVETTQSISLEGKKWNYITRNIMPFSASPAEKIAKIHPVTVGLNFEKQGNGVLVQATNAARAIKGLFNFDWFSKPITIPGATMRAVSDLISSTEILTISTDEKQSFIVIESPTVKIVSKLLEGKFIDTMHLYSNEKEAPIVWRTDRLELIEVARRIKRLDPVTPIVSILTKKNKCFATLPGVLVEQIGAVIESENKEGFSFNAFSLEAALSVLRCEEVLITCNKKGEAVTFSNGDEGEEEKEDVVVLLGQPE